ncbi:MAG TPA: hypothetical protein VFF32_08780 [Dermatophilaceae bacterium]|nr:hypothetical protein [Dermatophilaceae bacterium]
MTIIAFGLPIHRSTAALCASMTVALLTGCAGGSSTGPDPAVTVPATPAVTTPGAPTTSEAGAPKNDDAGRKFDLGTIVKVVQAGGVPVIIFDRWTARGVKDSVLAAKGVPMGIHSDARFENQNSKTTFRIPVVDGAIFNYIHCVAIDQPAQQRSSTLEEFARLKSPEDVIMLTLDPKGQVTTAQNDAPC